jgi:hypothetical protein
MKKTYQYIVLLALLFIPIHTYAQPPALQSQIKVSPALFNISLSPGKTYTYILTVENLQNQPVPLRAVLDSLATDDDGEFDFLKNRPSPLVEWTTISPSDLLIPAQGKQEVTITVKIPSRVPFGGYYAFLFLDPVLTENQSASRVAARIGIPLLANIGVIDNANKRTQIETFEFTKNIFENSTITTKMSITNASLHHYSVKPVLFIKPLFGKEIELPYEEKILFPGKGRRWEVQHTVQGLIPGFYNATMRVSTGNGNQITSDNSFLILPYKQVLLAGVILSLMVFIIVKRNRLVKAIKILLKTDN